MTVNTKSVQGRRTVHYDSLDNLLTEAEQLSGGDVQMLGNWTVGQVFGHLANAMNASIDGFPGKMPWPLRIIARLLMRKMLLQGPLRPGFRLPAHAEGKMVPPPETSVEDGLAALRSAIDRQKSVTDRVPHLALGEISVDDWNRAHLRHAELHMSFVIPGGE